MRVWLILPVLAAAGFAAGCGSSSSGSAPTAPTTTVAVKAGTGASAATTTAATPAPPPPPAKPGNFPAALQAQGHTPKANVPWRYTVDAHTKAGKPLGGSLHVLVLSAGKLINTIGWHAFDGSFAETIKWPPASKGKQLVFRVQVITSQGTRDLDYPVTVQ